VEFGSEEIARVRNFGERTRPGGWSGRLAPTDFLSDPRVGQELRTGQTRREKFVAAGRRHQHPGRVCSPEFCCHPSSHFFSHWPRSQ
jgi:hypothetical protein